jgi:hypothetical protein
MVKGINSLKTEAEVNQAVINIQRTLLEAQALALQDRERQSNLMKKIEELESRIKKFDDGDADMKRYELVEFPTGIMAYVLKEGEENSEPSHKLCPKCFGDGKKSILQVVSKRNGGESVRCPSCSQKYILHPFPAVQIETARSSWLAR